jgi:protein-S-isoprenylcysteine O-methyltransferase Ste14
MKSLDAPLIWLAGFVLLAWLQARLLPLPLPFAAELGHDIGALMFIGGVAVVIVAVRQMRRHRTPVLPRSDASALVTTGIFGKSRNPIYLGFVLILAGVSLWIGSLLGLVLVPVLVVVLNRRFIESEEAHLRNIFGKSFEDYAESTRRWL